MIKIKTGIIFFLLFITGLTPLLSRTVVFPFKVNSSENRAHQWLGRGISIYLSYGLKMNRIDTFSDNEGRGLLKSLNIKFPYNISKASIISAAKMIRAEKLIWGEVTTSPGSGEEILSIRAFLIDLTNLQQQYLPVIKGKLTDLFSLQKDLLRKIINNKVSSSVDPEFPDIEFDLRNYEIFIKGLLIDEINKKTELLEKVRSSLVDDPGILLFELARAYFLNNNHTSANKILNEIDPEGPFRSEKFFLAGIINYLSNNIEDSFNNFSKVLDCGDCRHETLNNIALIYALNNEYLKAFRSIEESVETGKIADSFFNAVNISILLKNWDSAWKFLREGLILYPSDEDLISLFFRFLKRSPDKNIIKPAFLKYLPGYSPDQDERKIFFKLINPFAFSAENYNMEFPRGNGEILLIKNGEEEDSDEIEKRLIRNPFLPEEHSKMAALFYEKGELSIAEQYGRAALFLKRDPEKYLIVLRILRKQGSRNELKNLLTEALKYFPENKNLKNFSLPQNQEN